jgi:NAD(P) transhydrogenase subunit alpha
LRDEGSAVAQEQRESAWQKRGYPLKIGALTEIFAGENRVAMTPDSATQLVKLGHSCVIQAGAGAKAGFSDAAYQAAGVEVLKTAADVVKAADVLVKVRGPEMAEAKALRKDQTLISFFWPAQNADLLEAVKAQGATVVAMDMVPRISRAQKMDALSSMANIAGYRAVIEASRSANRTTVADGIVAAAREIAETTDIKAICVFSQSGTTVSLVARERPRAVDDRSARHVRVRRRVRA